MRVESRAVAAILTGLLHLVIVLALVSVTASSIRPAPPSADHETAADRVYGAGAPAISVDIGAGLAARGGLACTGSSYVGVGVTAEPGSERIILVGDDTPASRAGLQHDDVVLNPEVWRQAHREGTLLHLVIVRQGVKMAVSVLVGKICIG